MRTVGGNIPTLLASKAPMWKADLFTITLLGGTIYRWTDFDRDIRLVVFSTTYPFLAQGPLLQRSRLGVKNTVQVPELIIKLSALDTDFVGGLGIKTQLHNGYFDGATVDRKSTRLNSSHQIISYAVFCLKKKKSTTNTLATCTTRHAATLR